jgi:hypothetical protein
VQQGGLYAWIEPISRNTSVLVIPSNLALNYPNQAYLSEGLNQKVRALCNKVGFMLGLSPNSRNTSILLIQLTFEFIKIPTKKHSTPMESLIGGRLYSKLSDSVGVLGYT